MTFKKRIINSESSPVIPTGEPKAFVITVAKHTETGEDLVVYYCFDENDKEHNNGVYAREVNMFLSEVDHKKYPNIKQKYRFEEIKN